MSNKDHDIDDDEIRIIHPRGNSDTVNFSCNPGGNKRGPKRYILIVAALVIIALGAFLGIKSCNSKPKAGEVEITDKEYPIIIPPKNEETPVPTDTEIQELPHETHPAPTPVSRPHVILQDTIVNGTPLMIFTPIDAKASLEIGSVSVADSTILMAFQAADIRADNGQIVSAFVCNGELISTGQSKAGFCAIIGGKITIGVADVTQYFEQALTTGGYFFRQYPLVVGNQVIENKPKRSSLRKALAELDGRIVVIASRRELTFREFSQTLVDLGVSTAIYLVGSKSFGFAHLADGETISFNTESTQPSPAFTNFIVWK